MNVYDIKIQPTGSFSWNGYLSVPGNVILSTSVPALKILHVIQVTLIMSFPARYVHIQLPIKII